MENAKVVIADVPYLNPAGRACFVVFDDGKVLRSPAPFTPDRAAYFKEQLAGPVRSPYELDYFIEAEQRRVTCHCCGDGFVSRLPQDPERDYGFGTCRRCRDGVAKSWAKHGFPGERPITLEQALERLDTYA